MFKEKKIMFLIAETPVHAGSGSGIGVIDLPIQRERHTDFPKIESSGLKGCLRDAFKDSGVGQTIINAIFGPENSGDYAGAMAITDARILLFPVKSLKGVFAWITCPMVIERFVRDVMMIDKNTKSENPANESQFPIRAFASLVKDDKSQKAKITSICGVLINSGNSKKIVLEEFSIEVKDSESKEVDGVAGWLSENVLPSDSFYEFWRSKLNKDLVVVDDDTFAQFVSNSTEVVTRVRISDETGTAEGGGLWTEEYLPQDTILYSLVMFRNARNSSAQSEGNSTLCSTFVSKLSEIRVIQVGGNATTGKGFVRVNFYPHQNQNKHQNQ
ncbi:MAG: type III-B CRISPR module RAMP protein Cmr4 [Spirochaetia bacterium]|nr:type III-B CRISPR module RAMP protein Cmr4 [Spirochaetota bacterium]MDW8113257.1 type III-B CRISPR module RAMP protein Cmr4 [Spirochaetia bacterium]